jgi:hypothetical protein
MENDDDDEQIRVWEILYARLKDTLDEFGREDWLGHGDYWIISDNWGTSQHKVYIDNLDFLAPSIVKLLQRILADFPDWEIVVAIDFKDKGLSWPNMGLTIRAHEIIDELQRQYFPPPAASAAIDGPNPIATCQYLRTFRRTALPASTPHSG